MFDGIKDATIRLPLERERTARLATTPISAYQYVDVTWTGSGERDIAHDLAPTDPLSVRWLVVQKTAAMDIYQPVTATAATTTTLWLTSSAAGTARLLLFLEA